MIGIVGAGAAPAPADLRPRLFQQYLVWWCSPSGPAPRSGGTAARAPAPGPPRWGTHRGRPGDVHHLREDHRPRRGQGPARPPEMQGARVPVPDRLLPRRRGVDGVEGQGDLDELFAGCRHLQTARSFEFVVRISMPPEVKSPSFVTSFQPLWPHVSASKPSLKSVVPAAKSFSTWVMLAAEKG